MKSITYGEVTYEQIARIIKTMVETSPAENFHVTIGTDSQNFDQTKVVVVIALHCVGKGGIFFYEVTRIDKIKDVRTKLFKETELSLDCAAKLLDEFDTLFISEGFDYENILKFTIHVDAGENGKSREVIPEIVGWVSACGYDVEVKPNSFAASCIANRISK